MKPWFKNVIPHADIRDGHLDESVFAANLSEVAEGKGREVYTNPEIFFSKTYFTEGLKEISTRVIKGLSGGEDSQNRVISLQTGFGGGKTHTLISVYHLAKIGGSEKLKDLFLKELRFQKKPKYKNVNIAVFTNKTNDPVQGRQAGNTHIRTIWGEIAYQLGGTEGYEAVRPNDEKLISPKGLFKKILSKYKPALILIDELADYCISASAVKIGNSNLGDQTISFIQELTEAVSETDNCVLLATLPASAQELAASSSASQILAALENRFSRIGANLKPVNDEEIFEVVRKRLFESIGDDAVINSVIEEYTTLYQNMFSDLPDYALKTAYKEQLKKSYPFHPELINMFRLRWASNPFFQRTRGVLRLLASIISDLYKRQNSLTGSQYLIHTSDLCLSNLDTVVSQITILFGANWNSVIEADISGNSSNAFRIDKEHANLGRNDITQGVSATILLGTFGMQGRNQGISIAELKLCMVKPQSFNHNDINSALDRLESDAYYLYYSTTGPKKYWYHTKPNINILITHTKSSIKAEMIDAEILKRLNDSTGRNYDFNILIDPDDEIPEQKKLSLIILSPHNTTGTGEISKKVRTKIEQISTKRGKNERIYRNTIVFLLCTEITVLKLRNDINDYLACTKVYEEYFQQLEKDQKDEIKRKTDEADKQANASLVAAYSVLVKYSAGKNVEALTVKQFSEDINNQYNNYINALKEEEWLIDSVGLNLLRNNNLLPEQGKPQKVKEIYESFLRFDDKPMITGIDAIQKSLLRYCLNGEITIATGDGKNFTNYYCKTDIPYFDVLEESYWLVNPNDVPTFKKEETGFSDSTDNTETVIKDKDDEGKSKITGKTINKLNISGKVPFENYQQLFTSFIVPFTTKGYKIDIEINYTIRPNNDDPLKDTDQLYKNAKESANQLGLKFEKE